jgi:DNA-binding MarR family transcriptional regulator
MNEAPLDDLSFYSLLAVLQCGMWLQNDMEKFLSPYGLSHSRFAIILAIVDSSCSPNGNRLAASLGVSKPTISKLIRKLIEEGYVECNADLKDTRVKLYSITKKASDLLENIVPAYVERLREMTATIADDEKHQLLEILSKINFLDLNKTVLKSRQKTITEKGAEIRFLCTKGSSEDIDQVLTILNEGADIPTTKLVDYYLGTVDNLEGIRRIEYYLFNGSQIQRNFCTLYFARKNEWSIVNKAFKMGLIDSVQAYSR